MPDNSCKASKWSIRNLIIHFSIIFNLIFFQTFTNFSRNEWKKVFHCFTRISSFKQCASSHSIVRISTPIFLIVSSLSLLFALSKETVVLFHRLAIIWKEICKLFFSFLYQRARDFHNEIEIKCFSLSLLGVCCVSLFERENQFQSEPAFSRFKFALFKQQQQQRRQHNTEKKHVINYDVVQIGNLAFSYLFEVEWNIITLFFFAVYSMRV